MMQKELQREYNQLVKEISREVLELSVSKSMEDASYTVKQQVPALAENIKQLKKVLDDLHSVNSSLTQRQLDAKSREDRIESQLKTIIQTGDKEGKKLGKVQNDITTFQENMNKKLTAQDKAVKRVENLTESQTEAVIKRLMNIHTLTEEGVATGSTTKKLLIWTFLFSIGSFGVLITFLLQTLGIITL